MSDMLWFWLSEQNGSQTNRDISGEIWLSTIKFCERSAWRHIRQKFGFVSDSEQFLSIPADARRCGAGLVSCFGSELYFHLGYMNYSGTICSKRLDL